MTRTPPSRHSVWRPRNIVLLILGVLVVLLVALQFLLEPVVLKYANRKLDEIPDYKGHIEDVDIHLWRGAYTIQGVDLKKITGKIPVPFFEARTVDLSVEWKALFQGKMVSEIVLNHPRLNFVSGPTDAQSQTDINDWQEPVEELFPFTINRLEIVEGDIYYRDYHSSPKVKIHLDHLNTVATGLTNAQETNDPLPATFKLTGRAMDQAAVRLDMKMAPLAKQPTFDLNAEMETLKLSTLNDFFRAYAFMDVEGGTLSVYTELAASEGRFKGYVKPLTKNIDILSLKRDSKNPFQLAWEALVGSVAQIFENQPKAQVGTQIPFEGSFSDPNPEIWRTIGALLRNAFIRALPRDLTHSIHLQAAPSAKEKKRQKKVESKKD